MKKNTEINPYEGKLDDPAYRRERFANATADLRKQIKAIDDQQHRDFISESLDQWAAKAEREDEESWPLKAVIREAIEDVTRLMKQNQKRTPTPRKPTPKKPEPQAFSKVLGEPDMERSSRKPTPRKPTPRKTTKVTAKRVEQAFSTVESSVAVTVRDKSVRPRENAGVDAWAKYTWETNHVFEMLRGVAGESAKRMSPVLWHLGDGLRHLKAAIKRDGRKDFTEFRREGLGISDGTFDRAMKLRDRVDDVSALEGVPIMKALRDFKIIGNELPDPTDKPDPPDPKPKATYVARLDPLDELLEALEAEPARANPDMLKEVRKRLEADLKRIDGLLKQATDEQNTEAKAKFRKLAKDRKVSR